MKKMVILGDTLVLFSSTRKELTNFAAKYLMETVQSEVAGIVSSEFFSTRSFSFIIIIRNESGPYHPKFAFQLLLT